MPAVTLLTDFGLSDAYVAELRGVLLSSAPGVALVDITHAIQPKFGSTNPFRNAP